MSQRYGKYISFVIDSSNFEVFSRLKPPNSLRDRSALLGVTPPASGRSSPFEDHQPSGHRFVDDLEGQNDEQLEGLSAKVKLLKDVSESRDAVCGEGVSSFLPD
jgi:hypothetical protein